MLYLGSRPAVDSLVARCGAEPVPSANPYRDRSAQPGSPSQRNVQRRGFDLLYTRAVLIR